jgi:putative membrane protein
MPIEDPRADTKAHVKLAQSATKLEHSAEQQTDSADRRTELAADRTILAAERTYAAWVWTGLGALASGIARALLDKLVANWLISGTGSVLILFSAFCFLAAVWRRMVRVAPPRPGTRRIPAPPLLLINGLLVALSLAALVGIWAR